MRLKWPFIAVAVILLAVPPACAQAVYDAHTTVELVSGVDAVVPGSPFELAVRMKTDPGWHVYWKNSGDSGLPVNIRWDLPEGFAASNIHWPIPERLEEADLTTYGYTQGVFLISHIVPPVIGAANVVNIKARVEWLACERICVPGKADLLLNLPVGEAVSPSVWAHELKQTRDRWPQPNPWPVDAFDNGQALGVNIGVPAAEQSAITSFEFFPDRNDLIAHSAKQMLRTTGRGLELTIPKSTIQSGKVGSLSGILVVRDAQGKRRAFEVAVDKVAQLAEPRLSQGPIDATLPEVSFWLACLFAFFGGLILNLMPCVLPVLSVKVLSFIEHADERKRTFLSGAAFTLGVLVSCWVLAGLLIFLKAIGRQIGWGFQFQSPGFIISMSLVLFLFALNLWGVFEIGYIAPQLAGVINRRHKYVKAFFSGVLAMILATPCTVPLMGTAISFAITQSAAVNILVFTFLGLGMSLPYMLLSVFPQALKFVPRPGPWMSVFKKVLALFLVGTVIWLVWILSFLAQPVTLASLGVGFLLMAAGAWILGREQIRGRSSWFHVLAIILLIVSAAVPLARVRMNEMRIVSNAPSTAPWAIQWLDYSPELMQELAQEGKTVFLDFTAKWCLSCQANERVALHKKEVADKFRELGVVAVKADWTRFDARITRALAGLGKNSIPVYVIYYGEGHRNMKVLPEILTPAMVLEALETVK